MGCDIHMTAEYRNAAGGWVNNDLVRGDKYDPNDISNYENPAKPYDGRNYDLFSILADVRNGYGFAGAPTGVGFKPIAPPRGLPDDATAIYRDWVAQWGDDGHSHSWFTVADLMAYDWTQTTTKTGVVGYHQLARFKLYGKPENWAGGVGGPGISQHDGAEAIRRIEATSIDFWDVFHAFEDNTTGAPHNSGTAAVTADLLRKMFGDRPVFHVNWQTSYYDTAGTFLGATLPRLWRLGKPDDVRICFFFDN